MLQLVKFYSQDNLGRLISGVLEVLYHYQDREQLFPLKRGIISFLTRKRCNNNICSKKAIQTQGRNKDSNQF